MTIDCGRELADTIEARLAAAAAEGIVVYGLHRQRAALMTCLTPSVYRSDHIHFLDGAAGGYSAAAASMKAKTGANYHGSLVEPAEQRVIVLFGTSKSWGVSVMTRRR